MYRSSSYGFVSLCAFFLGAASCFALETVSVVTTLTAPGTYNNLNSSVSIYVNQLSESKSGSCPMQATGNILADLGVVFDPITHAVVSAEQLSFTGGVVSLGSPHYDLDGYLGGFAGGFDVDGSNIQGTLNTPIPPGSVSGVNFDMAEHRLVLNGGTISVAGYGLIGSQMNPNPIVLDLATTQIVFNPSGTGTLNVSLNSIVGNLATYDVSFLVPVSFNQVVYSSADASVTMTGSGTLQSVGQFTRVVPEPGTFVLLAGLALCLAGFGWRKRHSLY